MGVALFVFIGGYAVMWLWNWLTPGLWGWPTITFWQALGLLVLCRILFGRMGPGRLGGGGRWRGRMRERYRHMTPEEKEHFKNKVREKWGWMDPSGDKTES
jgi:hypothetical protein